MYGAVHGWINFSLHLTSFVLSPNMKSRLNIAGKNNIVKVVNPCLSFNWITWRQPMYPECATKQYLFIYSISWGELVSVSWHSVQYSGEISRLHPIRRRDHNNVLSISLRLRHGVLPSLGFLVLLPVQQNALASFIQSLFYWVYISFICTATFSSSFSLSGTLTSFPLSSLIRLLFFSITLLLSLPSSNIPDSLYYS